MEAEAVSTKLRKSAQSSKEFISKGYHCFADYINKTYTEHKEKGCNKTLKMAFVKYLLVFLNIFYMLTSLLMMNIGTIGKIINDQFYFYWSSLDFLSIYWIASGFILLCLSVFGIIGAFKESIIWTNIYGVLMTIVFIIQISSAIIAFQFIGESKSIAWNGIRSMMDSYSYSTKRRIQIDWIQSNFQCCGNDGPSDWNSISKFARPTYYNNNYYYLQSTTTTLSTPLLDRMPSSCCMEGSNYNNLTCDKYYQSGCLTHIRELISESVMILGSVALAIAVLEILGIVLAFVVAKVIRKTKSYLAIQQYNALTCNQPNRCEPTPTEMVEVNSETVQSV